ncbi:MAG: hypothetical protein ACFFCW_50085 [Candidatus Hodarchaeota archaeon]
MRDAVSHGAHDSDTGDDDPPFVFHGILISVVEVPLPIRCLYSIGRTNNVQILSLKVNPFGPEACLVLRFVITETYSDYVPC